MLDYLVAFLIHPYVLMFLGLVAYGAWEHWRGRWKWRKWRENREALRQKTES